MDCMSAGNCFIEILYVFTCKYLNRKFICNFKIKLFSLFGFNCKTFFTKSKSPDFLLDGITHLLKCLWDSVSEPFQNPCSVIQRRWPHECFRVLQFHQLELKLTKMIFLPFYQHKMHKIHFIDFIKWENKSAKSLPLSQHFVEPILWCFSTRFDLETEIISW